ncbi:hypothetical protein GWO43_14250 [candidate division KSB1 bacterium]|nr:hypothetical protein [candidate division KSB1 bacterium]NIR72447.1 hypothetical protein [candidate division KSB1 bacterium]NIS25086.1 hypothetical protein [candidate division KSB1 bacterium]NIT72005.1 hypothetical protein [candidate division KSB1 bacterium]NIU25785.1 hypothetical protein [candidate division KSB1 bacterium]
MKQKLLFNCLLTLIYLNCATPSKLRVVKPEYEGESRFNATILVLPLNRDVVPYEQQLENEQNEKSKKTLLGRDRTFFYRYFGPAVSDVTTADVIGIEPDFAPDSIEFAQKTLPLDEKRQLEMYTPVSGCINSEDFDPDFILFLEDLFFDVMYKEEMRGVGTGSTEKYTMDTGIEYVLWDNKSEKIAAYGKINKSYNLMGLPTKNDYLKVLELFARSIIEKSPLVIKQAIF